MNWMHVNTCRMLCCSCLRYSSQSVLCKDFSGRPPSADICVSRSKKRSSGGERHPHVLPHSGQLVTLTITVTIVIASATATATATATTTTTNNNDKNNNSKMIMIITVINITGKNKRNQERKEEKDRVKERRKERKKIVLFLHSITCN